MKIELTSFGHKYGTVDADVVLDMRCLENPYWVPELKSHSGMEQAVQDYILGFPVCRDYIEKTLSLMSLQAHMAQSRNCDVLRIAIGCTGGRHRSVAVTELLHRRLQKEGFSVTVLHRDLEKG